jgi:hypothetical protein
MVISQILFFPFPFWFFHQLAKLGEISPVKKTLLQLPVLLK